MFIELHPKTTTFSARFLAATGPISYWGSEAGDQRPSISDVNMPGHVESLNWGNVFKNWWDLCSHNPGDPFRVGEGGVAFSTALRSHLKYVG